MREKGDFLRTFSDGREVYYRGKKVESIFEHPVLRIAVLHAAKLYDMPRAVFDKELNQQISQYFVVPRSKEDLLARYDLVYQTTMHCNGVFNISQAIGSDALAALLLTTSKIDRKYETHYSEKLKKYLEHVKRTDFTIAVAQTDVKGDRKKRPHEQEDLDMYVHVTEKSDDGIYVSGAKAHTTQGAASDEVIVIPTRAMTDKDKDFAIAFATPANTPGLKFIVRPIDELEGNTSSILSRKDFEFETLTIFDHVFVPWERVFLFREYDFAGLLAGTFATYHRFTAVSYRAATSNLYLGATSLAAKSNGIEGASHIRDRMLKLVMYKEVMKMSAIAAANTPVEDEGQLIPNPIFTNIGKLYSNQNFSNILETLVEVSGGIIATMPSEEDIGNEEESSYISKYLQGAKGQDSRLDMLKIAKELGTSSLAGYMLALMVHAEGSVEASKLALLRDYNLEESEQLIRGILSKIT